MSLASLSLGSGCIDVLSFLGLGGVFTSAMTGNTALLAIALGQGRMVPASRSLCSLLGFTLGVVVAALMSARWKTSQSMQQSLTRILLLEVVLLGGCALLWGRLPRPIQGGALYTIISLAALSMGIQAVAARSMNSSGVSTVVFTTGLMRIAMSATTRLVGRRIDLDVPSDRGHLLAFTSYGCGAVVTALLVARHTEVMIWVPLAAAIVALACSVPARRIS